MSSRSSTSVVTPARPAARRAAIAVISGATSDTRTPPPGAGRSAGARPTPPAGRAGADGRGGAGQLEPPPRRLWHGQVEQRLGDAGATGVDVVRGLGPSARDR